MKKIHFGTNFTFFIVFFGLATLEAISRGNILWIAFWVFVGMFFLLSDNLRKETEK
jgi:hypothetical protein